MRSYQQFDREERVQQDRCLDEVIKGVCKGAFWTLTIGTAAFFIIYFTCNNEEFNRPTRKPVVKYESK